MATHQVTARPIANDPADAAATGHRLNRHRGAPTLGGRDGDKPEVTPPNRPYERLSKRDYHDGATSAPPTPEREPAPRQIIMVMRPTSIKRAVFPRRRTGGPNDAIIAPCRLCGERFVRGGDAEGENGTSHARMANSSPVTPYSPRSALSLDAALAPAIAGTSSCWTGGATAARPHSQEPCETAVATTLSRFARQRLRELTAAKYDPLDPA